jgi:hypothetical protein
MLKKLTPILFTLALLYLSVRLGWAILAAPDTGMAVLAGVIPAMICYWLIIRNTNDREFLMRIFTLALALRWAVAFYLSLTNKVYYFAPDVRTYDEVGRSLALAWRGLGPSDSPWLMSYISLQRSGWGMFYYVGSVYYALGENQLAVQLINCAIGAAACVAVYKVTLLIYPEQRVARVAAVMAALSPSMILWSVQVMKDGLIVLSLCLCALYALKLRNRFKLKDLALLLVSLFCLFSLRHYAFYIMFVAIAGSLLFTSKRFTPVRMAQGAVAVLLLGFTLAYLGAGDVPQEIFNLKGVQASRAWAATAGSTGFGGDVDITDPKAALGFLPIGLLYVLFAPFPWMMTSLKHLITLPELIIWWALVPMLVKGYWHAVRHRLKESLAICVFTVGLTLTYALFQTNVGTAYRHRSQLYVFFFIFISIGLELRRAARAKKRVQSSIWARGFAPTAAAAAPGGGIVITPQPVDKIK